MDCPQVATSEGVGGGNGREVIAGQCVKCPSGKAQGPQPTQGRSGEAQRGKG